MVLRLHQHNIGLNTADGFYRSDVPTNSVKALKEGGYWLVIQTGLSLTSSSHCITIILHACRYYGTDCASVEVKAYVLLIVLEWLISRQMQYLEIITRTFSYRPVHQA